MKMVRWIPAGLAMACSTGVVETSTKSTVTDASGSVTTEDTDPAPDDGPDSADSGGGDSPGDSGSPVSPAVLVEEVTLDRLLTHIEALQSFADAHADNRNTFGSGFNQSVDYAVQVFEEAGYTVARQDFNVTGFTEGDPPSLEQITPNPQSYPAEDLRTLTYSNRGDVTAAVAAVDVELPPGSTSNSSTSACQASDFSDFVPGAVALIQRGSCTFAEKVTFAEAAGASAVILFNEGQSGRTEVESWTLDSSDPPAIPVLGTSFDVGNALGSALETGAVEVRVVVDAGLEVQVVTNVLAELPVGDPSQLLVVGAHLDSVTAGPGINDNGSGTAFVLAAAQAASAIDLATERRIRWALWGAEEIGLVGSEYYVSQLSDADRRLHVANLNFDMIGSPNGGRFIYDGDGSATGTAGPAGSDAIEALFEEWFEQNGLTHAPTAFDGRSDYGPFIWNGIPAGGLFSGAEARKSSTEAELFGGTAGQDFDACYHQWCDTTDNIDPVLFLELAQAAAYVTEKVAEGGGPAGPPPPNRIPMPKLDPHDLPLGHGHGHGHGCHPVAR
ncbi:MAG: aminopeptidase [Deltaproteobacteria bacterium]|nr:aminopeptidase [Deltaproteobacteria bacterium]HCH64057.1 aminopeptidase [Deltaproteobacteria bacterium]